MPPHNLPHELSSFVGREHEQAAVRRLLESSRIVTLVGTGGAGKTRLGLRVAREVLADFPGGVWLVELAPLHSPELVPQTIAAALGIHHRSAEPVIQTLTTALSANNVLLVLDNCEHLVSACADVIAQLLRRCALLHVLATTREPLGVPGELVWGVPSLSVPADSEQSSSRASFVLDSDAGRLFVERASAVNHRFTLTDDSAQSISRICRGLDGIPLAIELAAARANMLSPEEIASRLDDRFAFLVAGARMAEPRQQTLRAALDWSYDMLDAPARQLFARLSVYPATFSLEAVQAICSEGSFPVLEVLADLVNRSLVVVDSATDGGQTRYCLLETLRVLAGEYLVATGEAELVRQRHADWFCEQVERARMAFHGSEEGRWLRWAEREHANLRQSIIWSIEREDASTALRLVVSASWSWALHMRWSEAQSLLRGVLSLRDTGAYPRLECEALRCLAEISALVGDSEGARVSSERAGALAEALGDERLQLEARGARQILLHFVGDFARLEREAEYVLEVARRIGYTWAECRALETLALLAASRDDHANATAGFAQAERLARDIGDEWSLARLLQVMGDLKRLDGDHAAAASLYTESQRLLADLGLGPEPSLVHNLAYVALAQGDRRAAAVHFGEAIALFRRAADLRGVAECVVGYGCVQAASGHAAEAVRLFAAGHCALEQLGSRLWTSNTRDYERWLAVARRRLSAAAFRQASSAGAELTLEAAAAECTFERPLVPGEGQAPAAASPDLTPRELEVARRVAQGYTNRQVASALVVTEKTVANHLQHVLEKLSLHSRAQLAARALQLGIVEPDSASKASHSR